MKTAWISLLLITALALSACDSSKEKSILFGLGEQVLYQRQVNQLVELASFLAASPLSGADEALLRRWALEEFIRKPLSSSQFYQQLDDLWLPAIYSKRHVPKALEQYRRQLYEQFYISYMADADTLQASYDLMDIVSWYNPMISKDISKQGILSRHTLGLPSHLSVAGNRREAHQFYLLRLQQSQQISLR